MRAPRRAPSARARAPRNTAAAHSPRDSRAACAPSAVPPPRAAEEQLRRVEVEAGFAQVLLTLAADGAVPLGVRQAGAVYFKNLVRQRWADDERPIAPADKEAVKAGLLGLMVSVPELVRRQLSEALSMVSAHDFPEAWPGLLPELVAQLGGAASSRSFSLLRALLHTAHAMFKGYRHEFKSDELFTKMKYVLGLLQAPLLTLASMLTAALAELQPADAATAAELLGCLQVAVEVHVDLASQELPEYFEDHMAQWMAAFQKLLAYAPPAGLGGEPDEPPGPLEHCQAAVVGCLSLYIEK